MNSKTAQPTEEELTERAISDIMTAETLDVIKTFVSRLDNPTVECGRCGSCCSRLCLGSSRGVEFDLWAEPRPEHKEDVELLRRILVPIDAVEGGEGRQWYRCSMLKMNDGKAECTIYDTRPSLCKSFKPGDESCPPGTPCRKAMDKLLEELSNKACEEEPMIAAYVEGGE